MRPMSPTSAALSKVVLVADREPVVRAEPSETRIRRYRLARLHVNGERGRDPLAGLKRAYD